MQQHQFPFGVIPLCCQPYSYLVSRPWSLFYLDYTFDLDYVPKGMSQYAMVRCGPSYNPSSAIASQAQTHPSNVWLLCNEPDLVGQDGGSSFNDYANQIHWYISTIKANDPLARFIGPDVLVEHWDWFVNLDYAYYKLYGSGIPLDAYGVHVYSQRQSLNANLFSKWCTPPNCQNVVVTEFGQNDNDPIGYIQTAITIFKGVHIPQWFLFAASPPFPGSPGGDVTTILEDTQGNLTDVGKAWEQLLFR